MRMRQTVAATGQASCPARWRSWARVSLIFWALIIVVTVKYVVFIMRADNNGEGGVLALAALAHRSPGLSRRVKTAIGIAAIIGLGAVLWRRHADAGDFGAVARWKA